MRQQSIFKFEDIRKNCDDIRSNVSAIVSIDFDNTEENDNNFSKVIAKINFYHTEFVNCNLNGLVFYKCDFINCKFVNCKGIDHLTFTDCIMQDCDIESLISIRNHEYDYGIYLNGCHFKHCKFGKDTNLYDYRIENASFFMCDMPYRMYIIGNDKHQNYIFPDQNKACGVVVKHCDPDGKIYKRLCQCANIEDLNILSDAYVYQIFKKEG